MRAIKFVLTAVLLWMALLVSAHGQGGVPTPNGGSGGTPVGSANAGAGLTASGSVLNVVGPTVNVLAPPTACASCTMVGDDTADNTTAFNNITAFLQANGGGSIYFPSQNAAGSSQTFRINSCVQLPNDGSSPISLQASIHIYGDGAWSESNSFGAVSPATKGSTVDWRCTPKMASLTNQSNGTFSPSAASQPSAASLPTRTIATYLIAATSGLVAGQNIAITGFTPAGYNCAECTVLTVTANTNITVALPVTGLAASSVQGTVTITSAILPQATINVDQTSGWANGANTLIIGGDTVACTGTTSTSFTGCSGGTTTNHVGSRVLDSTGIDGKLQTLGAGQLTIDHINFIDSGSDCTPFIYDTNTTIFANNNSFYGTHNNVAACNDVFVLGGTIATEGNAVGDTFNGAGTVIDSNFFDRTRRAMYMGSFGTSAYFTKNNVFQSCGSNLPGGAAVELDGPTGSNTTGNAIDDNRFEVSGYPYGGIKITNGQYNQAWGNAYFDPSGSTIAYNRADGLNASANNTFGMSQIPTTLPAVFESSPVTASNTAFNWNETTGSDSYWATSLRFLKPLLLANPSSIAFQVQDQTGDNWQVSLAQATGTQFQFIYTPIATGVAQTAATIFANTSITSTLQLNGTGNNQLTSSGTHLTVGGGTTDTVLQVNAVTKATLDTLSLNMNNGTTVQMIGGAAPTCACTGGSPTCAVPSGVNNRGQIQFSGGTAVTTCTLTFSAAGLWHQAPYCQFTDANASITPAIYSSGACGTTTCVVDFAAAAAANINYHCF